MKVPNLRYQNRIWDINLSSIRTYIFNKEEIDSFIQNGEVPLDFDTNLTGKCNVNCKYCATQGGKTDLRFTHNNGFPRLADENISEIIKQLDAIGTKAFFLCSNGEPLLNPKRFLKILDGAGEVNISIITYTNGLTLERKLLRELHRRKVNLVIKVESLNPKLNDEIIFGGNHNKNKCGYAYGTINNQKVSKGIIEAFEVYGNDSDCLGIETMILKDNIDEVLSIREWAYSLGVSQFLKHLYPLGYAKLGLEEVMPDHEKELKLKEDIMKFDSAYGFVYPSFDTPDNFSYDVRRFMNNCVSSQNFPFRMFAHEIGGVYHSSRVVPIKFGFDTGRTVSVFDPNWAVDMKNYFNQIRDAIKNE